MAKAEILNKPPVTLTLDHEEAMYLKRVLQNPLGYEKPSDEPPEESLIRSDIWIAINGVTFHD